MALSVCFRRVHKMGNPGSRPETVLLLRISFNGAAVEWQLATLPRAQQGQPRLLDDVDASL
ncbi:MAG: hypothetical protein ACLVDB_03090 [Anaeromassilibacillus sp.]